MHDYSCSVLVIYVVSFSNDIQDFFRAITPIEPNYHSIRRSQDVCKAFEKVNSLISPKVTYMR